MPRYLYHVIFTLTGARAPQFSTYIETTGDIAAALAEAHVEFDCADDWHRDNQLPLLYAGHITFRSATLLN